MLNTNVHVHYVNVCICFIHVCTHLVKYCHMACHMYVTCHCLLLIMHTLQDPFSPKVNYSLSLLLRGAPDVSPGELLVYNHPKNMAYMSILHGSKHFRVDYVIKPRPPVADVEYIKESQTINVSSFCYEFLLFRLCYGNSFIDTQCHVVPPITN